MKILWLCNYSLYYLKSRINLTVSPSKFHPTTWIHYLIEEMKERDVELIVVTTSPYIKKKTVVIEKNITYHIIPRGLSFIERGFPGYFRLDTMTNYFILRKLIGTVIKSYHPDIITAHGTEDVYSLPLLDSSIPSFVWIQGFISDILKTSPDDRFLKKQFLLEKKVLQKQKHFISNCPDFDDYFYSNNRKANIDYLSYPISNLAFRIQDTGKDADICFTGSLVKRKGIEDFITLVHLLKRTRGGIRAKVIGGHLTSDYGAYLKELIIKYQIEDNITFLGYLPEHSDVLKEMKSSRVHILPTYFDTGPRSIAESMALKNPVVAYHIPGVSWMLGENDARGITVPPGNVEQLASAVELLLNNPARASVITKNAFKFATEHFLSSSVIDGLFEIYQKILPH